MLRSVQPHEGPRHSGRLAGSVRSDRATHGLHQHRTPLTALCELVSLTGSELTQVRPLQVSARSVHEAYCARRRPVEGPKDKGTEPAANHPMRQAACYLCGTAPARGIDRVDSSGTYSDPDNIRPACKMCNLMKSCVPLDHFLSQVARITCGSHSVLFFA